MTSKLSLVLALACAFLAGIVARDVLVPTTRADDPSGFRAQGVRELVRLLERNAKATESVADAVRSIKR